MAASDDRSGAYLASTMAFIAVSWICFGLRIFTRFVVIKSPWWDDLVLAFGMATLTMLAITVPRQVANGSGRHTNTIPPEHIVTYGMWFFVAEIMYLLCTWAIKTSVCMLLLRLELPRAYNRVLYAIITIVSIFTIYFVFWLTFQCTPVQFQWNQSIPGGHCIAKSTLVNSVYVLRAINAASDIVTAVVPGVAIFRLSNLNLDTKARIGASLTLAIASGACIATLVSFKYVTEYLATDDFLYAVIPLSITSNTEIALGTICASLATLRPLIRHIFGTTLPNTRRISAYHKYGSTSSESRKGSRASRLPSFGFGKSPLSPGGGGGESGKERSGRRGRSESDDTMRDDLLVVGDRQGEVVKAGGGPGDVELMNRNGDYGGERGLAM